MVNGLYQYDPLLYGEPERVADPLYGKAVAEAMAGAVKAPVAYTLPIGSQAMIKGAGLAAGDEVSQIAGGGFEAGTVPAVVAGTLGGMVGGPAGAILGGLGGLAAGALLGNIFGGDGAQQMVNGVPLGGPGLPEPSAGIVVKEWHQRVDRKKGDFTLQFYKLKDGRIMCYNTLTKEWKIWRPKKHIVISEDPRISRLRKLSRLQKKVTKMLKPYQPKKPKTELVPARALSALERKALKT